MKIIWKRIILFCAFLVACFLTYHWFWNIDLEEKELSKPMLLSGIISPPLGKLHNNWHFITAKNYNESNTCQWSEPNQSRNVNSQGIGEGGAGFVPTVDEKELMEQILKKEHYNLLASDRISLHRSLPDRRPYECKKLTYPQKLPTTSVIIIFHDEAWTTLLRTVWSVVDRSPPELIEEIILVDDMSTLPFLKRPLDDYIELIPVRIKIIRTPKREGLIRARLIGAQHATGNVLTFLDAHIECNEGWLVPLLSRIASDRSIIAVPVIDSITSYDMSYSTGSLVQIHGFRWSLIFSWMNVPERELIRTQYSKTAPIRTPSMIGCGFSIDREFFFEIGSYDDGMNIWGSENIEISLRVWQCGGSLEIIPCSRIGHLFRISTYSFDGDAGEIKAHNKMRLVEVWMSDLKDFYYSLNSRYKNLTVGDLTERKELKTRLKCKDFRWYLENVYPESTMQNEFLYFGEVKSVSENKCLDIEYGSVNSPIVTIACHKQGGNQFFGFTKNQVIVTDNHFCVGVNGNHVVVSLKCDYKESQWWTYDQKACKRIMIKTFQTLMRCSSSNPIDLSPPDDDSPCSGRGDCLNGTCLCEIRYSGDECTGFNLPYHAGVSSVFYFVAIVSLIQLLICIVSEYQRLKQPSFLRACRLTTQKLLYFVVFIAALLRGAYFTTPEVLQPVWASNLMSAYYPLLMTCASLVVCLWAEIFHLRNIRASQFLSKSFLGFLAFNLLPYSLFGAEVLASQLVPNRNTYAHIFNGCYAALLLIVVVFFLIYGVEVFFKIRGEFIYDCGVNNGIDNINSVQVHHARFGLLSQAIMMIVIVGFLTSETLGDFWKKKVPVYSRNWHDIVFRLVEVGVALWFPCCLWNSMAPEQLWILNPRKLLRRQIDPVPSTSTDKPQTSPEEGQSFLSGKDCWICYDSEKLEPLIQPCKCTGDVSSVHHECLRRWLVESCSKSDELLKCKVCGSPYEVERTNKLYWEKGFTINHWAKTIILVTLMCVTGACAWVIIQVYVDPIIRVMTAGIAILIGYVCVKLLGENTVTAYQRAKVSSINIITGDSSSEKLNTICQDVQCK